MYGLMHILASILKIYFALADFKNRDHENVSRNHSLSAVATEQNSIRSHIRVRVENVFGFFTTSMGSKFIRKIMLKRNKAWLSLKYPTFNLLRYLYLSSNSLVNI